MQVTEILLKISGLFTIATMERNSSSDFHSFFDFLRSHYKNSVNCDLISKDLNDILRPLETEQLLALIILVDLAIIEVSD